MFGGVVILSVESECKAESDLIKSGRIEENEKKFFFFRMWDWKQEKVVPRGAVHIVYIDAQDMCQ